MNTKRSKNGLGLFLLGLTLGGLAVISTASAVTLDASNRYYRDASNNPVFLIGYYDWSAVPDGYFIDHPSRYSVMIQRGVPYKLNYVRMSSCVNRFTSTTTPQSWNNQPTPTPFLYVSGKADLNQWDATFWTGMRNQCALAQQNGVTVHIAIFDGVELRGQGGAAYGYNNSFWNPANQSSAFYPAGDYSDTPGGFYRLTDFNNNTGIGYYQKLLIAKTISETAAYSNVFYEIGNELIGSDVNWNTAVFNYIKSLTSRPVTQVGGTAVGTINGYSDHVGDTAAQVKSYVASFVSHGYPAWIDPDGPGLSDANVSSDELRRAAWYCFAGGAAGWGGFTVDYWFFGHGFNSSTACYYKNLQTFIKDSGVQFWNMIPSQSLVGNNGENSCLARTGEAVVYVLNDASVTVDLTSVAGTIPYRLYDPRAGTWGTAQTVNGGAVRTFNKPAGADDWVIYLGNGNGGFAGSPCPAQEGWSILGTQQALGAGITPGVATDSQGNIHVVYMNNGAIYYRKGNSAGVFSAPESIPVPEGAANYNSPHVVCDTNGDPHLVFERDWYPSTSKCWYTNRKGGSWKPPVLGFQGLLVMYCRLVLYGSYAFVTASTSNPDGMMARFSNLNGTPQLDLTANTYLFAPYPVIDSTGKLFVIGRNSGSGHYLQQYNLSLSAVGGGVKMSTSTPNKTGEPTAAVIDAANLIHVIGNCGATGIDPESSSDIWYNKSQDGGAPAQGSALGLSGMGWMGQVVYPHCVLDKNGILYMAYRNEYGGDGKVCIVTNGQFSEPFLFTPAITDPNIPSEQRRWNCQLAPTASGGVYVTWDYNGQCYIQSIGANAAAAHTLNIKTRTAPITIDGNPSDWNLVEFTTKVRAGQGGSGDIALVGYDAGSLYYSGYYTGAVLPVNAADHTAKVYSRHDADYLYFLVRCDDNDIQFSNPVGMNWANDCVEFYIDPANARGSVAMNNSTSNVQLVIDANNQVNVYVCTPAYSNQVLSGVTSAVARDATGWWLEARIAKTVFDPDLLSAGAAFGLDFNFRDNDNNNDVSQTTIYTWSDNSSGGGFPSKIPDEWGTAAAVPLEVSIDLGSTDILNGMTHPQNADGNTAPVTIGGRSCRQNVNTNVDSYFYFGVSDAFAFQGNKPDLYVSVDYFDSGTGSLSLQYDSNTGNTLDAFYKDGGSVALTGSNTWKRKVFHVTDAYFGNRQNAAADFRIAKGGGNFFYLDLIRVIPPQPPPLLRATGSGNAVVISWPASTIGFTMQSINSLSSSNWTDVTNNTVVVGSDNTITDPLSNTNKFFRMRKF